MVKVTFTLDDGTVETLRRTASKLRKPQSMVVREAIQEYATRSARMSDEERREKLKIFDRMMSRIPRRPQSEADGEIAALRTSRRSGGRRTRVE
jgi:hypothetical protein